MENLYRQPANVGHAKYWTKRLFDMYINLRFWTWQVLTSPGHSSDLHNLCYIYHSQKLAFHQCVGRRKRTRDRLWKKGAHCSYFGPSRKKPAFRSSIWRYHEKTHQRLIYVARRPLDIGCTYTCKLCGPIREDKSKYLVLRTWCLPGICQGFFL